MPVPALAPVRFRMRTVAAVCLAAAGTCLLPWRLGIVHGHSMEPTLAPGSVFVYRPGSSGQTRADRGDIVLLEMAGKPCVKRIYAVAGQEFWALREREGLQQHLTPVGSASHARVRAATTRLMSGRRPWLSLVRYRVPPGHVFVTGDAPSSLDSRQLGSVPVAAIRGKVVTAAAGAWRPKDLELSFPPSPKAGRRGGRASSWFLVPG